MKQSSVNSGISTLVELLRCRATEVPDGVAFVFLREGTSEDGRFTYQDLDRKARSVAVALSEIAAPGQRALLSYQSGLDFVAGFFGCLYAGIVPIPAPPPRLKGQDARLQTIVSDAQPTILVSTSSLIATRISRRGENSAWSSLKLVASDVLSDGQSSGWRPPAIDRDSLALLQYTSGSTTVPRAVMVSHQNVLRNSEYIKQSFELTKDAVSVTWLPNYHDMGLIDGIIQPIYAGFPAFLMSPVSFLQQPIRWLQAISDRRATHSGGPNFAYDLCVSNTTPQQREGIDLSSWSTAYDGAEPIRSATLRRFADTFAPCGFRSRALYPCYGLAEATLMVSGGSIDQPPITCSVPPAKLRGRQAVAAYSPFERTSQLVGCGRATFETKVVIVDPESGAEVPHGKVGEIWVSGPGVAMGYWCRPDETAATFRAMLAHTGEGPFLRTGDLGFLRGGELFVTGRLKDIVIVRGQNHYPQDIELTVENSHKALKRGCGAAFSVGIGDSEELIVVQEVERSCLRKLDVQTVVTAVRRAIAEEHDLQAHAIVLLRPGGIAKTSSGKIQRHVCRSLFLAGTLTEVGKSELQPEAGPATESPDRKKVSDLTPLERKRWLTEYLRQTVSHALRLYEWDQGRSPIELGIDSLTAIQLSHRLETELHLAISPADLLQVESFETLADRLVERLDEALDSWATLVAPAAAPSDPFPLSAGQKALWFLHQLAPESNAYNVSFAVRIDGELNQAALRDAFQLLSDRHAALRTSFTANAGHPMQRIHPQVKLDFQYENASGYSNYDLQDNLDQQRNQPFDLGKHPLMRVRVYRCGDSHTLLLTAHHIAIDFWSLVILLDEFREVYGALASGRHVRLPQLYSQFPDYVRWQSKTLQGPEGDRLMRYWHEQLAAAPTPLELSRDKSRPSAPGRKGSTQVCYWDAEFTEQLRTLAKSRHATLYMLLLAAFQVLLYRYTWQADILVGTSVAGRYKPEFAGLVGYFANQLVMRSHLSAVAKFTTFLDDVKQTVLAALAHQEYPFSLLVERLQPARNLNRSPLIQVMFGLEQPQRLPELASLLSGGLGASMDLGELKLEYVALDQRQGAFDLNVMVFPGADGLKVSWEYDQELFSTASISQMSGHFEMLLRAIIEDPEQTIGALPLLKNSEREQVLVTWNQTGQAYPQDKNIQELFEEQVRKSPDAIAVTDGCRGFSYLELNRRANQLAHHLRDLGVGPEVLVGILLPRSLEMFVAVWGVLKAGGVYVPLDPLYPQARLSYLIEDAQVKLLLTQEQQVTKLPVVGTPIICLDSAWEMIAINREENLDALATPENLAYVIYTSGSSGKPKGTGITQRGLVNYVSWAVKYYEVGDGVGAPVNSSLSFDATVTSLFCPLLAGRKVVLMPELEETAALSQALSSDEEFSLVKITPAQLDLLKSSWPSQHTQAQTKSFVLGGEALIAKQVAFWQTHASNTKFINEYGPTEAVVGCCCYEVKELPLSLSDGVPIGRPIANAQVYLLDENFQPVPIGVVGEIYIGGAGLARGYVGLPALTAEKFLPHPFGVVAGARLYRTGDLARYMPDGTIDFVGRRDDQVKIRGYRVELDEIRAVLLEHPSVSESAIKVVDGEFDDKQLVAYVVADSESVDITIELRSWLSERLPAQMVPSWFVSLKNLPLTPNGKIDKQALSDPPTLRPHLEVVYAPPVDDLECLIASIWRDLLRLDKVGVHDSFFDLGGHSLLIAQVHRRLQHVLMQEIPITELLQHPTINSLAKRLRQRDLPDFQLVLERTRKQKQALTFQRKLMMGRHDRRR